MTATVFVTTDYVDNGGCFWFDHIAWALQNHDPSGLPLPNGAKPFAADRSEAGRRKLVATVLSTLKNVDEGQANADVQRLLDACPLPPGTTLGRALTWAEIREMSASGIEFGSHTVSHRCLARLSSSEIEWELRCSKERIESEIGKPVTSLAYPFGGRTAFNAEVIDTARRLGYRMATSYMPGANLMASADRFALRRQHVERDTTRDYFEAIVNFPELF